MNDALKVVFFIYVIQYVDICAPLYCPVTSIRVWRLILFYDLFKFLHFLTDLVCILKRMYLFSCGTFFPFDGWCFSYSSVYFVVCLVFYRYCPCFTIDPLLTNVFIFYPDKYATTCAITLNILPIKSDLGLQIKQTLDHYSNNFKDSPETFASISVKKLFK